MAKSNTFPITVHYGREHHKMEIGLDWKVKDLSQYFWNTFSIPVDKQKIINQGKVLSDPDASVDSLKLKSKAKLMLLGDPVVINEHHKRLLDDVADKITQLDSQVTELESRISEGVVKGFLPKSIQPSANLEYLQSIRGMCGQCMDMLESLDCIQVSPKDSAFREKRKSLIAQTNKLLNNMDHSMSQLKTPD